MQWLFIIWHGSCEEVLATFEGNKWSWTTAKKRKVLHFSLQHPTTPRPSTINSHSFVLFLSNRIHLMGDIKWFFVIVVVFFSGKIDGQYESRLVVILWFLCFFDFILFSFTLFDVLSRIQEISSVLLLLVFFSVCAFLETRIS